MYRFIIFDLQSTYIFSEQPESIEQTIGQYGPNKKDTYYKGNLIEL